MRKLKILLASLALITLLGSCGQSKDISPKISEKEETTDGASSEIDEMISEQDITQSLRFLSSDELQGRATGSPGIEKAAAYIEERFRSWNVEPYFRTYRDSFQVQGKQGFNVVGFLEGTDPELKDEFIIIGAHYDHIGQGEPSGDDVIANGANDNASGTATVMQLARYFAHSRPQRSMLFTLFSAEEKGLVGSEILAKRLKSEGLNLYVMFNIEMVGVPLSDKPYLAYLTGFEKSNLAEKFNEYAGKNVIGFLPQAKEYNLFQRSDNYPFFQAFAVPSHTISTFDFTNYDYYHHVEDEFEHMDTGHMEALIEALIPGLTGMANSKGEEIKMNED